MHGFNTIVIGWFICVTVPLVLWGIAEFRWSRRVRLACAGFLLAANLVFALVAVSGATIGKTFEYNMGYSNAASRLVGAVVTELERGQTEKVIAELKALDEQFLPGYEQRGRWDELVEETVARLSQQSAPRAAAPEGRP